VISFKNKHKLDHIISQPTYKLIATFFGAGYLPKAPGTFGALAAMLLSFALTWLPVGYGLFNFINFSLIILSYTAGVMACNALREEWGSDPSRVVIDEACGYWVALIFVPLNTLNFILAFILFRFFDILKPLGIKKIDALHNNGHAVMLDDVAAGLYSCIVIHTINYLFIETSLHG
jgi:phosphatidylglycerophosphatase A